ncbi:MAG: hypothetical protein WCJ61_01030, partial [Paludibacter sp.]
MNSSFIRSLIVIIILNISGLGLKAQNDSTSIPNPELQTFETYKDFGYNQSLRPQFHFTSLKNWLNDPNGMVWYDG